MGTLWADDTDFDNYDKLDAGVDDSSNTTDTETGEHAWEQIAVGSNSISWAQVVAGGTNNTEREYNATVQHRVTKEPWSGCNAEQLHRVAEPGDPVGIRAVQSILMSATQMSLSHFHTAGMGTGSNGADVRPSAADAMDSAYTAANTSMRFEASSSIWETRKQIVGADLGSFVTTIGSSFTSVPDCENVWYKVCGSPVPDSFLRLYIDYRKMHNHGLTLKGLAQEAFGEDCKWMVSPDFMGMIDVQATDERSMSFLLSKMGCRVCGTPDIMSCDMSRNGTTVVTKGTNILAVSRVLGVVKRTVTCNNIAEVEMAFGIEAAAGMLSELVGSHVVSDFMARTGRVLPFNKRSTEVQAKGLLTSMGFERPKEDIREAIISGVGVYNTGGIHVYEAIMTGADPPQNFRIITGTHR